MHRKANPMFLICESPTHVGSGSDVGIIDLPIQRERHTDFPKIEASSLKGSIRAAFEQKFPAPKGIKADTIDLQSDWIKIHRTFGYDDNNKDLENATKKVKIKESEKHTGALSFAGAIGFSDARILFFPVKSMKGVFAWITCPAVLNKLVQECKLAGIDKVTTSRLDDVESKFSIVSSSCVATVAGKVVLEEFTFTTKSSDSAPFDMLKWLAEQLFPEGDPRRAKFVDKVVILSDEDFKEFVNLSTEVITRTKINNETGTVQTGGLFTVEYLPTETILYTLALTAPEFTETSGGLQEKDIFEFLTTMPDYFQIGADATLGKGIMRHKILRGGN